MSRLLTQGVARTAVEFVLPSVQALIRGNTLKRGDLHIVIAMQPAVCRRGHMVEVGGFEECIIYEHSLGEPSTWASPFDKIARSKGLLSWERGMSTQQIQALAPHLLEPGDTSYYGSVFSDGIVVACSGVQPFFDHMISAWVLEACRALCIQARETVKCDESGFVA